MYKFKTQIHHSETKLTKSSSGAITSLWFKNSVFKANCSSVNKFFFFKINNITMDPDPNWAKILDPDPRYLNPQHCKKSFIKTRHKLRSLVCTVHCVQPGCRWCDGGCGARALLTTHHQPRGQDGRHCAQ